VSGTKLRKWLSEAARCRLNSAAGGAAILREYYAGLEDADRVEVSSPDTRHDELICFDQGEVKCRHLCVPKNAMAAKVRTRRLHVHLPA